MKRRLVLLLLLLVAGAIVNVTVAWAPIAQWSGAKSRIESAVLGEWDIHLRIDSTSVMWTFYPVPPATTVPAGVEGREDLLPSYGRECLDRILRLHDVNAGSAVTLAVAKARGFPMLALRGAVIELSKSGAITLERIGMVSTNPNQLLNTRLFPVTPIWPGFAINTVFYAAILWMFFAAPFALRRRRRIQRGLCPACAYPVGGSDVCNECGTPYTVAKHKS